MIPRRLAVTPLLLVCAFIGCIHRPLRWPTVPPASNPTGKGEFDLMWKDMGVNGAPDLPRWVSQEDDPSKLPPISEECKSKPYRSKCTAVHVVDDAPGFPANLLCFQGHHKDWVLAETRGTIGWLNYADDFDYNFRMFPLGQAAATASNDPEGGRLKFIELEFDSRETADYFVKPWWSGFRTLIRECYGQDGCNWDRVAAYLHHDPTVLPCGVVFGLLNLDCEHGCKSEYHPVYAMAIQINESPDENIWAVFARNWGNGGFCSGYNHELDEQYVRVLLPFSSTGPPEVVIKEYAGRDVSCPSFEYKDGIGKEGIGEVFTFPLPDANQGGLAEMLVEIKWPPGSKPSLICPPITPAEFRALTAAEPTPPGKPQSGEKMLGQLLRDKMGKRPQQLNFRNDILAKAPALAFQSEKAEKGPVQRLECKSSAPLPPRSVSAVKRANRLTIDTQKQVWDKAMFAKLCEAYRGDWEELEKKANKKTADLCRSGKLQQRQQ